MALVSPLFTGWFCRHHPKCLSLSVSLFLAGASRKKLSHPLRIVFCDDARRLVFAKSLRAAFRVRHAAHRQPLAGSERSHEEESREQDDSLLAF
ncbi:MAG: hypothetical protein RBR77_14475 [Thauera sp.]|nr:hypothetical protein [Thauera sp.]